MELPPDAAHPHLRPTQASKMSRQVPHREMKTSARDAKRLAFSGQAKALTSAGLYPLGTPGSAGCDGPAEAYKARKIP